jgi:hypothetical protein
MDDEKLYAEIMKQIMERDAISFKLLAFVPTISGVLAFLTLWKDVRNIPLSAFILIGLLGCAMTFFVWRWECRNIQFCTVLRESAAKIEEKAIAAGNLSAKPFADFRNMPRPDFLGIGMGKTESERGLYIITMLLWLALPCIAYLIQQKPLL